MSGAAAGADASRSEDDRALTVRFLGGDEAAFRELYRRHAPAIYAFATRLSGSATDGEDLLQEAWVRGGGRLAGFRWESGLRTWLCGIAVNCWREMRRRGPRDAGAADPRMEATSRVVSDSDRIDLDRAIRFLPEGFREVLILHDLYGHTHAEIGRLLGMREGSSRSRLSRARSALRARLGAPGKRSDGMEEP
ncbi:MAG: RNA polymerase sigma factor [Acidobacteriota bacterium]